MYIVHTQVNINFFKLFDRRFLLQLSIQFGSSTFFANFLPAIVETILPPSAYSKVTELKSLNVDSFIMQNLAKESILWYYIYIIHYIVL